MKSSRKPRLINTEKLFGYVVTAKQNGQSDSELRKNLIAAGWPENLVEKALSEDHLEKEKPIIKCENLTKKFGHHTVLDDINIEVKEGEIFGIIGLSGSGKTTLLNSLIGFIEPESGDVLFKNSAKKNYISIMKRRSDVKRLFGFATQDPSFYTKLTAEENLDHFGSLYGLTSSLRKTNVNLLLGLMGLSDSRKTLAENLSGGMQRRLGIACSLIHDPKVLILDEPTADLDPFLRKDMADLLQKINQQGTTIILSSHFLDEIDELCDRVAILHDNKIVHVDSPEDLKSGFSKDEEIHLELASKDHEGFAKELNNKKKWINNIEITKKNIVLKTSNPGALLREVLQLVEEKNELLVDLSMHKPTLCEVFESIIKQK